MVAAEVTMATAADIPTLVTMEVATTEDTVVMVGTGAMDGVAATTVGAADIGAMHTTVTDGDWVLALGGRIGVGDIRIATATALGTLPTLTTTRIIVLRDTHVLPTGTTLRLRIPAQNPGVTQQSLGDRR
jgi:hypothetical protein